jgi:GntR family negative regulator for fad regulon and positive regulator of fabA
MPDSNAPLRPALHAEQKLVTAILEGLYPAGSTLPAERELAVKLGVTRPTLRETLQRLERDGWITIQQGRSTLVNDIWTQGGLNVLSALVRNGHPLPAEFVPRLLEVRQSMGPAYARAAVERNAPTIAELTAHSADLAESPEDFAAFDWKLQHTLTVASGNPIYTLILNGFTDFYQIMGRRYFANPAARAASRTFYADLHAAALAGDADLAEQIVREALTRSVDLWRQA